MWFLRPFFARKVHRRSTSSKSGSGISNLIELCLVRQGLHYGRTERSGSVQSLRLKPLLNLLYPLLDTLKPLRGAPSERRDLARDIVSLIRHSYGN